MELLTFRHSASSEQWGSDGDDKENNEFAGNLQPLEVSKFKKGFLWEIFYSISA